MPCARGHACLVSLLIPLALVASHVRAEPFRILAWNVESNRPGQEQVSDPGVISEQLAGLLRAQATQAQIVALSEVEPKTVPIYREAIAEGLWPALEILIQAI